MAAPWELVLHYTFAGAPGVIFDHSPARRSHGQPVNLSAGDFVQDGATTGSGAVRVRPTTGIRVPISESWRPLGGLRIELICETELLRAGGSLITADTVAFSTGGGYFGGDFSFTHGWSGAFGEGGGGPRPLPATRWLTVAVQYGAGGVHAEIDGDVVSRWDGWDGLLSAPREIVVGNDRTGARGLTGLIDDIKIWRMHPQFIGKGFVERPVSPEVGRCWAEWSRRLDEMLRADPDCAEKMAVLLPRAMFAMMSNIPRTPEVQAQITELSLRYQEFWKQGRLSEVSGVLADLVAVLRNAGFNPANIALLQELLNDPCFASFGESLPMNCDSEFTDMFAITESF